MIEEKNKFKYLVPNKNVFFIKFKNQYLLYNKNEYTAYKISREHYLALSKLSSITSPNDKLYDKSLIANLIDKGFLVNNSTSKNICNITIQNQYKPYLNRIMIEITNKCNLRCKHCYVWSRKSGNKTLDWHTLENLITTMEKTGIWQLDLTGGEISTHPNIIEIMNRLKKSNLLVNMFTNLSSHNKLYIEALIKLRPKLVISSIDGSNADTHDNFRGVNGAYSQTIHNIKLLKKNGINVRINVSLSKQNISEIDDIVNLLEEKLKVPYILGDIQCTDTNYRNIILDQNKTIDTILKYRRRIYIDRSKQKENLCAIHPPCGVGYDMMFINSSGESSLCPTLTRHESNDFYAGNIYSKSIKIIWEESNTFTRFRNIQCKNLSKCNFKMECKGGCRSRAYLEHHNLNDLDPTTCGIVKKLYKHENKTYTI